MQHLTTRVVIVALLVLVIIAAIPTDATAQTDRDYWPTGEWRTSAPAAQGMDAALLEQMLAHIDADALPVDSVIVVRHGYIVLEEYPNPFYGPGSKHNLYSTTKSVTSALIGVALEQGFIDSTAQRVVDFFPDREIAHLDARKQAMTLEHLLTMSAGFEWEGPDDYNHSWGDALRSDNPIQFVLDQPMAYDPGDVWVYNGGCSHLLSAILTATTGQSTLDFARETLFGPLGITNVRWPRDPQNIYFGGQDIWLTPPDMARFGYLFLNDGVWDGQQIVSADWVARSSATAFTLDDGGLGYGYQWWTYPELGVYGAWGAFEQRIFVIPDLDMVVVFTAENRVPTGDPGEYQEGPGFAAGLLTRYILPAVEGYDRAANHYADHGFAFDHPPARYVFDQDNSAAQGDLTIDFFDSRVNVGWSTAEIMQTQFGITADTIGPDIFFAQVPFATPTGTPATLTTGGGYDVTYQPFVWEQAEYDIVRPGMVGTWHCAASDRFFYIALQSRFAHTAPDYLLREFEYTLASFDCAA
ncbi:MAG: beta-lactamase family protein [Anaerolineae bacterium]|nr:beta-lactamase family protein [Anaerolineae bacterium]